MKLSLIAIGRAHDADLRAAIDDYTARLSRTYRTEWRLLAPAPAGQDHASAVRHESERLMTALPDSGRVFVLDERGDLLTTPQLAKAVAAAADGGTKELAFVIGGAYGVSGALRQRADVVWSLSPLVFPHQLVRLILAEQLYRATAINVGHPYHHT